MKVLLVEPEKSKSWGANQQYIGLLKIGEYHLCQGDEVEYVYAPTLPKVPPEIIYVTSMFTYWYKSAWNAVQFYKSQYPQAKVILGGIYATICPAHARLSGADEVMVGQHPQARYFPPNPTLIPVNDKGEKPDFAYCFTSYGCTGNCRFCGSHLIYGNGIHQRPAKDIVSEFELQYERGYRKIYFGDDDLLYNAREHFIPIIEDWLERKKRMEFYVWGGLQSRWITPEIADLMVQANFKYLSFGFESVSPTVLQYMNRKQLGSIETLDRALGYLKDAKFDLKNISVYFMVGLPYQKPEDMLDTFSYLVSKGVWAKPQRWAPIPGTPDYKLLHLETYDLEDLYYKEFTAPGQNSEFLERLYSIARYCNMGLRYSGLNLFDEEHRKDIRRIINYGLKIPVRR